jgi:hypothetical protein
MAFGLSGFGGAGAEPSEAEMKDAMLNQMNHPPGETVPDPIKIVFFKKEACDAPTPQGFRCTFDVKVASRNIGCLHAQQQFVRVFLKEKETGEWAMRPPF